MTITSSVLGIVPGLQATALLGQNLKLVPKKFGLKKSKRVDMKKPIKKIVKVGVITLVGIGLIKPTAQMINTL